MMIKLAEPRNDRRKRGQYPQTSLLRVPTPFPGRKKIAYSVASGVLVFGIVNCLMLGLDQGEASIVIPIANMSFVVALFISGVMGLERIDLRKGFATVCAVGSIALLANV